MDAHSRKRVQFKLKHKVSRLEILDGLTKDRAFSWVVKLEAYRLTLLFYDRDYSFVTRYFRRLLRDDKEVHHIVYLHTPADDDLFRSDNDFHFDVFSDNVSNISKTRHGRHYSIVIKQY